MVLHFYFWVCSSLALSIRVGYKHSYFLTESLLLCYFRGGRRRNDAWDKGSQLLTPVSAGSILKIKSKIHSDAMRPHLRSSYVFSGTSWNGVLVVKSLAGRQPTESRGIRYKKLGRTELTRCCSGQQSSGFLLWWSTCFMCNFWVENAVLLTKFRMFSLGMFWTTNFYMQYLDATCW